MSEPAAFEEADHFVFSGEGISGVADTTSLTGKPTGSIEVDGATADELVLEHAPEGWIARAHLSRVPDGPSRSVTLVLPRVNLHEDTVEFTAFAVVVTTRSRIGGPRFVKGALQRYDVRPITGTASLVAS
jgi:hypothetical protein